MVRLLRVDDDVLEDLLVAAVDGAEPEEAMPPVAGPPGWTGARREAFRAFHRERRAGFEGPVQEITFAVAVDGEVVGSARLRRTEELAILETGLWLARSARGRGIGTAVLRALADEASALGAEALVAETNETNAAALGALRSIGSRLTVDEVTGLVHARLPVARRPPRS
jgi:RimJ/RimL family protein N-acetyltransferase